MKRIMVRLDDDLYTRIFETAHDQRLSMNAWIVSALSFASVAVADTNNNHPKDREYADRAMRDGAMSQVEAAMYRMGWDAAQQGS